MTRATGIALALAFVVAPAAAQAPLASPAPPGAPLARPTDRTFYRAADLQARCASRDRNLRMVCAGYVSGIADAVSSSAGAWGYTACIPLDVTPLRAMDIVARFLDARPDGRDNVAANVVAAALAEAYPCRTDPWATPGATASPAPPAPAPPVPPPAPPAPTRR